MGNQAPITKILSIRVPAVAGGADSSVSAFRAPAAATVTGINYTPDATITGAATNNRAIAVTNKGQSGIGAVSVASLGFGNGTNATGYDEKALTLSGTAANLVLAAGDILTFDSTHVGTGIADPGGLVSITLSYNDTGA